VHYQTFSLLEKDEWMLVLDGECNKNDSEIVAFRKKFIKAINLKRKATRRT